MIQMRKDLEIIETYTEIEIIKKWCECMENAKEICPYYERCESPNRK